MLMTTQQTVAYCIAASSLLITLVVIYCWIQSERILNWYIKKYQSEPRLFKPKHRRSKFHRFFLSVFFFPIPHEQENFL
jgi:hypothetical protein